MKKLRFLPILLCSILLNSCSDSEPVGGGYPTTSREEEIKRSCGKMNKVSDILDYESFRWATVCWGWDQDYPSFYDAMSKVDSSDWNHLMGPLNEFFFNNRKRRDKYLELFNELDREAALDDLAQLLNAFNENNLNDIFYRVFGEVIHKQESFFGKSSFFEMMDILYMDRNSLDNFGAFFRAMNKAFEGDDKNITAVFRPLIEKKNFREKRIELIDQAFEYISSANITVFERSFIQFFLSFKNPEGKYWFHNWIRERANDPTPVLKILSYERSFHPTATRDFSSLISLSPTMPCHSEGGDKNYVVNVDEIFRKVISELAEGSSTEFLHFVNQKFTDIHLANSICDIREAFNKSGTDISSLLGGIVKPTSNPSVFSLLQHIHRGIFEAEEESGRKDIYYFIRFYLSDFFQEMMQFNQYLVDQEKGYYLQVLINIISSYPEKSYESFVNLVDTMLEEDSLHFLRGAGEFWMGLSFSEKEALLNVVDIFFKEDVNYIRVLKFFETFVGDLKDFFPLLADRIAKGGEEKTKTLDAIYNISKNLRGEDILNDLRKIFSRDEILRTVQILTGAMFGRDSIEERYSTPGENQLLDIESLFKINKEAHEIPQEYRRYLKCFDHLSQVEPGFENLLYRFPKECEGLEENYFSVKLVQYLNSINDESMKFVGEPLLAEDGLASKHILSDLAMGFFSLESKESPMTSIEVVDLVGEILFSSEKKLPAPGGDGIRFLEDGLRLIRFLLEDNEGDINNYLLLLKKKFAELSDSEISEYTYLISDVLEYYSQSREQRETFKEKYPCEKVFPITHRLDPCPSRSVIKEKIKSVLNILRKKHEGKKTPLELLTEAVTPGYGIRMPFLTEDGQETYINHVIDIQQYLLYSYDTFINADEVRYYTGLDEEKDFFDSMIRDIEQTEIVIRDISFFGNYFGYHYLNSTVLGWDYIEEAKKSTNLFKNKISRCLNGSFCRKFISPVVSLGRLNLKKLPEHARFWAKNVVNTAPALIAVGENYEHQGRIFNHDDFMKAIISIFVQSSPDEAQYNGLFSKMSEKYMGVHNGEAILRLAELSALRNTSRFFYDRIGPEQSKYDAAVFGDEIQRINRNLLRNNYLEQTQGFLLKILNEHLGEGGKLDFVIDSLIDWIADLPYDKQRVVEEVVGDLLIIMSSLGEDSEDRDFKSFGATYASNSIFKHVDSLENLFLITYQASKYFPEGVELFDLFDAVRDPIRFLRNGLSQRKFSQGETEEAIGQRRKVMYRFINESFRILDAFVAKSVDSNISQFILSKMLHSPNKTLQLFRAASSSLRDALRGVHLEESGTEGSFVEDRNKIYQIAQLLSFYSGSSNRLKTYNIRNWLVSTFYPTLNGQPNGEYRKFIHLIDYLLRPSRENSQQTNLRFILREILVADYNSLKAYIEEVGTFLGTIEDSPDKKVEASL